MHQEKTAALKDRLSQAMTLRNMRAVELCEKSGVPKSAISYYRAGKSSPKAGRLNAIAAALGVSEAWLLGYDVPMERSKEQKKNDDIVRVVALLRKDPEFFEVVQLLADLPAEQYASIKAIVSALGNK